MATMDLRPLLREQHQRLRVLLRQGPPTAQAAGATGDDDFDPETLRAEWALQERLLRRVLSESGNPLDTLHDWHKRTQSFCDRYPELEGWTDRQGESWDAQPTLRVIESLLDQLDEWTAMLAEQEPEE